MASKLFEFTVDNHDVLRALNVLKDTQVKYSIVNALNDTAKVFQEEERKRVKAKMTLRSKGPFILRQAAIITFASVKDERYEVRVRVGDKKGLLLADMEQGGQRLPRSGKSAIAVPVVGGARPSKRADVPAQLMIRNLPNPKGKRRKGAVGNVETYRVKGVGIFQRRGRGVSKLLYAFSHSVKVPKLLGFMDTANRVVGFTFQAFYTREIARSIAHSFGRGPAVRPKPSVNENE